jgi:hypothetical protein
MKAGNHPSEMLLAQFHRTGEKKPVAQYSPFSFVSSYLRVFVIGSILWFFILDAVFLSSCSSQLQALLFLLILSKLVLPEDLHVLRFDNRIGREILHEVMM